MQAFQYPAVQEFHATGETLKGILLPVDALSAASWAQSRLTSGSGLLGHLNAPDRRSVG